MIVVAPYILVTQIQKVISSLFLGYHFVISGVFLESFSPLSLNPFCGITLCIHYGPTWNLNSGVTLNIKGCNPNITPIRILYLPIRIFFFSFQNFFVPVVCPFFSRFFHNFVKFIFLTKAACNSVVHCTVHLFPKNENSIIMVCKFTCIRPSVFRGSCLYIQSLSIKFVHS